LRFPKGLHDDCADSAQYQNKIAEKPFDINNYEQEQDRPIYKDIGI
jgi:hypothetical protein